MLIITAAVMLMAFAVVVYIVMGVIGWYVLKFIFEKWSTFLIPIILLSIFGGWVFASYSVGAVDLPRYWGFLSSAPSAYSGMQLPRGMIITGVAIIGLGVCCFLFVVILEGIRDCFSSKRR